jgi:uncharacterized membrane protein
MQNTQVAPPQDRQVGKSRIWEVDVLRGLAIILMVLYHLGFDLQEMCGIRRFLGIRFDIAGHGIVLAQYFFAGVFVVLSGVSSTLSHDNVRRALRLLGLAILVSVVTYVYSPSMTILFGILHCLGVSILVYGLAFSRARWTTDVLVGAVVIGAAAALPAVLRNVAVGFDWLLPFGITSPTYSSYDYFPLLPWFGIFLLGAALGRTAYASRRSLIPARLPATPVNWAGRHSLWIYIVHQPLLLGILYLLGLMR